MNIYGQRDVTTPAVSWHLALWGVSTSLHPLCILTRINWFPASMLICVYSSLSILRSTAENDLVSLLPFNWMAIAHHVGSSLKVNAAGRWADAQAADLQWNHLICDNFLITSRLKINDDDEPCCGAAALEPQLSPRPSTLQWSFCSESKR